jgi:undecaprenyl-diphosphatase
VLHRSTPRRAPALTRARIGAAAVVALAVLVVATPAGAVLSGTTDDVAQAASDELTAWKAAVLGLVEGVTEYLPISSTAHLHVTQRLLDVGTTKATEDAADTYAITIQGGAILAVLLLYRRRLLAMFTGAFGRDEAGRRVLVAVVIALVPAVGTAVVFEQPIKDNLLGAGPIVAAWVAGGLLILWLSPRLRELGSRGIALDDITPRHALLIGVAQILALWPGTSRSLVTIVAGVFLGLSLAAAVEFSFLLGFVTLAGATAYETLKNGDILVDTYGVLNPLIGFAVAFVSAAVAIRWMVTYLQRHDLSIFGWYRLAVAALTLVLLATGAI